MKNTQGCRVGQPLTTTVRDSEKAISQLQEPFPVNFFTVVTRKIGMEWPSDDTYRRPASYHRVPGRPGAGQCRFQKAILQGARHLSVICLK